MPADPKRELNQAFAAFTEQLREMLTAEAQRSVDGVIANLDLGAGGFRVEGLQLEVVIRELSVTATDNAAPDAKPPARKATPRKRSPGRRAPGKPAAKRERGRPAGALRTALLAEFAQTGADLTVEQLRERLDALKVSTTTDNLHQQLRRLVSAGQIQRVGRGVYSRSSA